MAADRADGEYRGVTPTLDVITTRSESELRSWIREHEVCWELDPQLEAHEHRVVQVGFRLSLLAKRSRSCSMDPGCDECARVFETLEEIARRAVPEGARVDLEPFDSSFHLRPETGFEPEVELVVEVLHHDGTFEPPDAAERLYPSAMRKGLEALGVQPKTWSPLVAARSQL